MLIKSIFLSINGECCEAGQGSWAVFIRFSGCTAGCSYCDTKYSFTGGKEMSVEEIVSEVKKYKEYNVTLTGGEPLEQDLISLDELIYQLMLEGYGVSVETNGVHTDKILHLAAELTATTPGFLTWVVDYKLPSAGSVYKKMDIDLFKKLPSSAIIKFVIKDDFDYSCATIIVSNIYAKETDYHPKIFFSPCGLNKASWLFKKMKETEFCRVHNIKYNLQIHKVLFPKDWREEEQ